MRGKAFKQEGSHIRRFTHQSYAPKRVLLLFAAALCMLGLALCPCGAAQDAGTPAANGAGASSSNRGIAVTTSQQLFATMCALDAAGFAANESTLSDMPQSIALRADMLQMQGPAAESVREFYREHLLGSLGETLSRYTTFALVVGPPPGFAYSMDIDLLPPDAVALDGFQKVLGDFYREAHLDRRWEQVESEYQRAAVHDDEPVRQIVQAASAYLREPVQPSNGRSFTIYVEPLVGNRTNFRNFGDRYAMVIGAEAPFPEREVRHAYLHFLLDPLPLRYRDAVETKAALLDVAARAPQLPSEYQTDFVALMDECLIKAVEVRLDHLTPDRLEARLNSDDRSGYILVRPLTTQLEKFENEAPAMSYYFPDLIAGISVPDEQKRLTAIKFAAATSAPPKPDAGSADANPQARIEQWLADGDQALASRDAVAARDAFGKALQKDPGNPRGIYGMALASVLGGDADRAKSLFESLVSAHPSPGSSSATPDPAELSILAWAHVYLGRIHDLEGERELATNEYHAALNVAGAPEAARVAAQEGLNKPYAAPGNPNRGERQKP